MAEQSRRFVSLDKPIDKFIEDQKNKNTLSKTRRDVSLLTEFLNSKNESRRIEEIPPKELNEQVWQTCTHSSQVFYCYNESKQTHLR